jgi:hypothetical protein
LRVNVALVAIVLVSQPSAPAASASHHANAAAALPIAIASGVAIGVFFLALARTSRDAGLWPLLAARGASAVLFAAMALVSGHGSLRMPRAVLPMAIAKITGGWLGAHVAIRRGSGFVRGVFLVVVGLLLMRFAVDVFFGPV